LIGLVLASARSVWLTSHNVQNDASQPCAARVCAAVPLRVWVCPWYYHGMKVAVSIPEDLFDSAESLGKRLGLSRSHLYATALAEFLAKHRGRKTTERLNRVYAQEDSRLERPVRRLQARSIREDSW